MEFVPTRVPDVVLVKPRVFGDARGFFLESWKDTTFSAAKLPTTFVQDNHSRSGQWILRGLHYQVKNTQGKLVRVTRGAVYDVAVDMRRASPTFGQWVGAELTEENHHMLWVPPGFAHGFLTLTETVDFLYKCTDLYAPEHERVLRWDDPTVGIVWPLPAGVTPQLSARDAKGAAFGDAETL
jgi:dTDP-4-dehydrorhamnose 3,5-epimerase